MRPADALAFALRALGGFRLRSALMLLAMAIAVAAVLLLSGLGEGARRYVLGQFQALGTNLLVVIPGRAETTGGPPPLAGETPRDLTLDDALALRRNRHVLDVAPVVVGQAPVAWGNRSRDTNIIGTTRSFYRLRNLALGAGRFLPAIDPHADLPVCVLGRTVARELFGGHSPLGETLRIGGRRFRVIGVLAEQGQALGAEIDKLAIIPVASAMDLFDRRSLFRILVQARDRAGIDAARREVLATLRKRHEGEEDVTVLTQDALLSTFDRVLAALTLAVAAIAAISLLVAGILIMNVMLVAVSQRTAEIGLLAALGATRRQILALFLLEAALLALLGGLLGVALGYGGRALLARLVPAFPLVIPAWALAAALGTALASGLLFGIHPARQAARLDPVVALAGGRR